MKNIVIVGASGFAREIKWIVDRMNAVELCWNFLGYIDSHISGNTVIGDDEYLLQYSQELSVAIAIADTKQRQRLAKMYQRNPMLEFPNLIDPAVLMSESVSMGKGNFICAGSVLTVDIDIGDFCIINLNCTVGHECVFEDFVTVSPGANISGNVHLSEGVNVGTGCQIIQGRCVGINTVVGAGAVITRAMPGDCTVAGVPAKIIKDRRTP